MSLLQPLLDRLSQLSTQATGDIATGTKTTVAQKSASRPWKLKLPNVSAFSVKVGAYDMLLLKFGLLKRLAPEMESTPYVNRRANRYLGRLLFLLNRALDSKDGQGRFNGAYWRLALMILQRSNVYMVACIQQVCKNWHRDMPFFPQKDRPPKEQIRFSVLTLNKDSKFVAVKHSTRGRPRKAPLAFVDVLNQVMHLRSSLAHTIDFHRTYILKPNGKWRPLGVPTLAWRIYLNMWYHFVALFVYDKIPSWQHAFKYGMGTLSAWKEILSKVINSRDIAEFDLQGFFPSVSIPGLRETLFEFGFDSPFIVQWTLLEMQMSPAKFLGPKRLDESKEELKQARLDDFKARPYLKPKVSPLTPQGWVRLKGFMNNFPASSLPQGSNLSPILSILVLIKIVARLMLSDKILFYADDGLLFGDLNKEEIDPIITGSTPLGMQSIPLFSAPGSVMMLNRPSVVPMIEPITAEPEKSGWVKLNHQWLKPLKFLGLTFVHASISKSGTDELHASTRRGSDLLFTKAGLLQQEELLQARLRLSKARYAHWKRAQDTVTQYPNLRDVVTVPPKPRYVTEAILRTEMFKEWLHGLPRPVREILMLLAEQKDYEGFLALTTLPSGRPSPLLKSEPGFASHVNALSFWEPIESEPRDTDPVMALEPLSERLNTPGKVLAWVESQRPKFTSSGPIDLDGVLSRAEKAALSKEMIVQASPIDGLDSALPSVADAAAYFGRAQSPVTWNHFVRSRLAGFIQSKLYSGSWIQKDFAQDFSMTRHPKSWASLAKVQKAFPKCSVFNSTSLASQSLLNLLNSVPRTKGVIKPKFDIQRTLRPLDTK